MLWTWGRQENDCSGHIWVRGISVDDSENIYISGSVLGNVSIGDFQYTQTWSSAFFAKMTPDRTIVFAKFANNLYGENRLVKTAAGEFLIGGSFQDNPITYEGVTLSPTMNSDVAVLKVSSDGSPIWIRRGSGSGYDEFNAMASNSGGDIFVATTTFLA